MKNKIFKINPILYLLLSFFSFLISPVYSSMTNYCSTPPFVTQSPPPLIMLVMGKDHKMFYEAYNDASDLNGDGRLDVGYNHSIDYYGYFDIDKCYSYDGSKFVPVANATNKFCGSGRWSGNVLNWLTMSRMDVLRKVLYGGYRSTDTASETILERAYIPQDAHSWGKEFTGRLCSNGTIFTNSCMTNSDCETGFTCVNKSIDLIGINAPDAGNRHLFCSTTLSDGGNPILRMLTNRSDRVAQWASKERPVCDNSRGTPTDYIVRVRVCDSSVAFTPDENKRCKRYPNGNYKPIGILHKYGESDGTKVCSNNFESCTTDANCNSPYKCIPKSRIYYGLLTGSYNKNMSGGVVRKNISSFSDEINQSNGVFLSSENGIYNNVNKLKITQFSYSGYSYSGGWKTDGAMTEGSFQSWGNPVGEMMYEAVRYFAGLGSPTGVYSTSGGTDGSLGLSNPNWIKPLSFYPVCSKPFIMTISDVNNSFDSDQLPGGSFGSIGSDLTGLNVTTLTHNIGTDESISGNYFIGQNPTTNDNVCTAKPVSNLGQIRGLCPEEPTKQGTYYAAGVAHYARKTWLSKMSSTTSSNSTIEVYSVAVSSPAPDFSFNVGGKTVRFVPSAKSVSGCLGVYSNCAQKCPLTQSFVSPPSTYPYLNIGACTNNGFCPTNQIVDYYVQKIEYNPDGSLKYAKFAINFEDVEQGADHDMDAIVTYEIITEGLQPGEIKIKLSSDYAAGCIDQAMGFIISGTTQDGQYLGVRDVDSATDGDTPPIFGSLGLTWEKTFTVTGDAAKQLEEPLYFAAKWGGFEDSNNNDKPDGFEWDTYNNITGAFGADGIPDNYFKVTSPLIMEQQLDRAFSNVLKRAAAGSSVASIAEKTTRGNLLSQAIFYPEKEFDDLGNTKKNLKWLSNLNFYWYFSSKKAQNIRDDYINRYFLDVYNSAGINNYDRILDFRITSEGKLLIDYNASDAEGASAGKQGTYISIDDIPKILEAGKTLQDTSGSSRQIYGVSNTNIMLPFNTANLSSFNTLLGLPANLPSCLDATPANRPANLIGYIRGESDYGCRTRTVQNKIWKMGDIIYSTPRVVEGVNTSGQRTTYTFVGANDGMLHVFKTGFLKKQTSKTQPIKLCDDNTTCNSNTTLEAKEIWSFIPKNVMPYLRYYADPGYCHLYFVDLSPYIVEYYKDPVKKRGLKSRYLIGGLRFGGACGCGNATACVNPPTDTCPDINNPSTCVGLSSYFALDITNPEVPVFKWEFSHKDLGFSLTGPAVIKKGNSPSDTYVVFGSGPTKYDGNIAQPLKLFAFKLDTGPLGAGGVTEITNFGGSTLPNAFSGRLFTDGFNSDKDDNGTAEYFALGYTQKNPNWSGGIIWADAKDSTPANWSFSKHFTSDLKPVTTKVEFMDCFDKPYIYFGTGRWFYKEDNVLPSTRERLYGVPIICNAGNCSLSGSTPELATSDSTNFCSTLTNANRKPWYILLNLQELDYYFERLITDPSKSGFDAIYFTTMQPTKDVCGFGGRSRIWGLNCATGGAQFYGCPDGKFKPDIPKGASILLQLSGGNIKDVKLAPPSQGGAFTQDGNRTTDWFPGTPPETSPPVTFPGHNPELLLYMER